MIVLPLRLVPLKYPGYFWHIDDEAVYSIKSGILKRLSKRESIVKTWKGELPPGFSISHKGRKRHLTMEYLRSLSPNYSDEHTHIIKINR